MVLTVFRSPPRVAADAGLRRKWWQERRSGDGSGLSAEQGVLGVLTVRASSVVRFSGSSSMVCGVRIRLLRRATRQAASRRSRLGRG